MNKKARFQKYISGIPVPVPVIHFSDFIGCTAGWMHVMQKLNYTVPVQLSKYVQRLFRNLQEKYDMQSTNSKVPALYRTVPYGILTASTEKIINKSRSVDLFFQSSA